ncbi:MAG: DUF721 domain-containing protein [Nitrospirae bacterium]|nr:DUF721 domain-containing protein [Nitrospirota bacterium]
MHSLSALLKKYFKESGLESGLLLNRLNKEWPEIVGKAVSEHSYPETLRNGTLVLSVDSPQWMHHLGFYKNEICLKLSAYNIHDIRFKLGSLAPPASKVVSGIPHGISNEDMEYIESILKDITDPELKEKFRSLIAKGLARANTER